ncbi:MAG: hypothetical protein ACK4KW_14290 [Gemmobacter sp.]
MSRKTLQLDAEALLSEMIFGHGYLHYGYWPNGSPDDLSAMALGQAQEA